MAAPEQDPAGACLLKERVQRLTRRRARGGRDLEQGLAVRGHGYLAALAGACQGPRMSSRPRTIPERFRRQGHRGSSSSRHLARRGPWPRSGPAWRAPDELLPEWVRTTFTGVADSDEGALVGCSRARRRLEHLHHPRYIGLPGQPRRPRAGSLPASRGAAHNGMAVYEMGPAGRRLERQRGALDGQGTLALPEGDDGILTNGGSMGT